MEGFSNRRKLNGVLLIIIGFTLGTISGRVSTNSNQCALPVVVPQAPQLTERQEAQDLFFEIQDLLTQRYWILTQAYWELERQNFDAGRQIMLKAIELESEWETCLARYRDHPYVESHTAPKFLQQLKAEIVELDQHFERAQNALQRLQETAAMPRKEQMKWELEVAKTMKQLHQSLESIENNISVFM